MILIGLQVQKALIEAVEKIPMADEEGMPEMETHQSSKTTDEAGHSAREEEDGTALMIGQMVIKMRKDNGDQE